MHGNDINIALFLFFIPYILLEVPSNMFLKKLRRPRFFIGFIVTSWSICVIGQGLTASFGGLVGCRVLIGVFEAGVSGC
jgi:MFS family permease